MNNTITMQAQIVKKINELDDRVHDLESRQFKIIIMYNHDEFPEIGDVITFIGQNKVEEIIKFQHNNLNTKLDYVINKYRNDEIALMVGLHTDEILVAQNKCQNYPNIHLVSGASTVSDLNGVLRVVPSDEIGSEVLMLFARLKKIEKIYIVRYANNLYGESYSRQIRNKCNVNEINIDETDTIFDPDNTVPSITLESGTMVVCLIAGDHFTDVINAFELDDTTENCHIVGMDSTHKLFNYANISNTNGIITNHDKVNIYICVLAPDHVTETTNNLYNHIYASQHYDKNVSPMMPFVHDAIVRMAAVTNFSDISKVSDPNAAGTAFTTYSNTYGSPIYGGFWFMQACINSTITGTTTIETLREKYSGTFPTLMRSICPELWIGKYPFAGKFGYIVYKNEYEKSQIDSETVNRFSFEETTKFNESQQQVKIAKHNGKWRFPSYSSNYPIDSAISSTATYI